MGSCVKLTTSWTCNCGGHSACRWCGSSYSIRIPSLKLVGLPIPKTSHISVLALVGLETLTFDLSTSKWCGGSPGFSCPFSVCCVRRSRLAIRHGRDRQQPTLHYAHRMGAGAQYFSVFTGKIKPEWRHSCTGLIQLSWKMVVKQVLSSCRHCVFK